MCRAKRKELAGVSLGAVGQKGIVGMKDRHVNRIRAEVARARIVRRFGASATRFAIIIFLFAGMCTDVGLYYKACGATGR